MDDSIGKLITTEFLEEQIEEYKGIYKLAEANFSATQNPKFLDIQLKCLETIRRLQEDNKDKTNE